jgi:DNA-binding HxlR family transcriptional regulator
MDMPTPAPNPDAAPGPAHGPAHGVGSDCRRMNSILGIVGDKWTILIVMVLAGGPRRFNDIKRTVGGISQQMLTRTLKALERDGTVSRTVHPTVPPQVEYALTPLGHSLATPLRALGTWARGHLDEIDANRARYDARG